MSPPGLGRPTGRLARPLLTTLLTDCLSHACPLTRCFLWYIPDERTGKLRAAPSTSCRAPTPRGRSTEPKPDLRTREVRDLPEIRRRRSATEGPGSVCSGAEPRSSLRRSAMIRAEGRRSSTSPLHVASSAEQRAPVRGSFLASNPRQTGVEVGAGGSGTPPGPAAKVSGEIASCWPTPGLRPVADAARERRVQARELRCGERVAGA